MNNRLTLPKITHIINHMKKIIHNKKIIRMNIKTTKKINGLNLRMTGNITGRKWKKNRRKDKDMKKNSINVKKKNLENMNKNTKKNNKKNIEI